MEDSDDDDDEEDILWMGAELERRLLNNADVDHVVLVSLIRAVYTIGFQLKILSGSKFG